jgi:hypothetical protein
MTIAEQIVQAVATLINNEGKTVFTREEVREKLNIDRDRWLRSYSPIFQGMRAAPSGKGPNPGEKYKNVFDRVEHGKYQLTEYGKTLI